MTESFDDEASLTRKDSDMQDSEMTPATETGSISEDSGGGWFGLGSDVKAFARSIKDTTTPAIGGFASFLHRSALTVAAEIASLEREAQLETERWREENYGKAGDDDDATLHLPWEVPHNSKKLRSSSCDTIYEEDEELMKKVLELSRHEETFLGAKEEDSEVEEEDVSFSLDEPRINLIRRLLELDDNLAAMHAKLSGTLRCTVWPLLLCNVSVRWGSCLTLSLHFHV